MSCTLHDVHEPQSARASITTSHFVAISWRRSSGAGFVNVGLAKRSHSEAARLEQLLEPVEEHVAARLGDVEQPDRQRRRATPAAAPCSRVVARALRCRIEQHAFAHVPTSLVTGSLPTAPLAQPPMIAENSPAVPPACTISSPPSRNFGSVVPAKRLRQPFGDAAGAAHEVVAGELELRRQARRAAAP